MPNVAQYRESFKSSRYVSIDQFRKLPMTNETVKKCRDLCKSLIHVRINSSSRGMIFRDQHGHIVGYFNTVKYGDGSVWLQALEVTPEYQGKGIGTQLLKYAIKKFNVSKLSVARTNEVALRMYQKCGFTITRESDSMYFMELNDYRISMEAFRTVKEHPKTTKEKLMEKQELFNQNIYPRVCPLYLEFRNDLLKAGRQQAIDWAFYKKVDYTVDWNTEIYEDEKRHIILDVEIATYNYYAITRGKDPFLCRERSADIHRFLKSVAYMYESRFQLIWHDCSFVFDVKGDTHTYYLRFVLDDLK